MSRIAASVEQPISVPSGSAVLHGDLVLPDHSTGVVIFAHGSGSSRHSRRNRYVANVLQLEGLGTLLLDLLTPEEEAIDSGTGQLRFDIGLLSERVLAAIDWVGKQAGARGLKLGCFGASTGAAAALVAAAARPDEISALVSRGGRPDLAGDALPRVHAPTLLIVGGEDHLVLQLNQQALARLRGGARLEIIPGATHLFEEPGALEVVARLAAQWFGQYLRA